MKIFAKYILIVFLILMSTAALIAFFESSKQEQKNIPLSELALKINAGEVEQIAVKGETLEIKLRAGDELKAKKEPNISVFETLLSLGANQERIAETNISIEEPSGAVVILSRLLPALLPFGLIILIFWFMFRQAQKGSMQAFTFGKSRAKLAGANGKKV